MDGRSGAGTATCKHEQSVSAHAAASVALSLVAACFAMMCTGMTIDIMHDVFWAIVAGDGEDLVSLEKSRLAEMLAEANSLQEQGAVLEP
jgi:hypothetical protein